jgi:hypothetical protein
LHVPIWWLCPWRGGNAYHPDFFKIFLLFLGGKMSDQLQNVDHSAIQTNQAIIIVLLLAAFIFNYFPLVALIALVMLIGTIIKKPGFGFIYFRILKPLKLFGVQVVRDNPEPHRFAQGFGATVLILSALSLGLGNPVLGWGLSWLVIFLAALNLFVGFCAGCAVYYWLNRIKVPGFTKSAPLGTIPGMRPK